MREITQNGVNLIKRFEGFSQTVYFCTAGYPTIGYAHGVKDDEDFSAGIDEAQAEELLRQGAVIAERIRFGFFALARSTVSLVISSILSMSLRKEARLIITHLPQTPHCQTGACCNFP